MMVRKRKEGRKEEEGTTKRAMPFIKLGDKFCGLEFH
jgi:hypothetical protein